MSVTKMHFIMCQDIDPVLYSLIGDLWTHQRPKNMNIWGVGMSVNQHPQIRNFPENDHFNITIPNFSKAADTVTRIHMYTGVGSAFRPMLWWPLNDLYGKRSKVRKRSGMANFTTFLDLALIWPSKKKPSMLKVAKLQFCMCKIVFPLS